MFPHTRGICRCGLPAVVGRFLIRPGASAVILNAYAVLDAFVGLLRMGLVVPIVWLCLSSWARWRRAKQEPGERPAFENRFYLLLLLAGLLLVLNVLAWPIFYLLLQSYVSEWPGVMCIYGVTRIGAGSVGSARYLPVLLDTLRATKPLLVFASGAWFVLYLVNRRTRTAPLSGRVLLGIFVTGLLAGADATAELAYLFIPKKEEFLARGCCTTAPERESGPGRVIPPELLGGDDPDRLALTFVVANTCLIAASFGCARWRRNRPAGPWLAALLGAVVLVLLLNWAFITEFVVPKVLNAPGHHCAYDLVARAPPSVAAVALFVLGSFCVGWSCCVAWLGREPEAVSSGNELVSSLLYLAAFGFAAAVLILGTQLALV
jgi:hypothetical protein